MVNYAKRMGERPAAGGPQAQPPPPAGGFGHLLSGTLRRAQQTQAQYPRGSSGMNMAPAYGQTGGMGTDSMPTLGRPRPVLLDW